MKQIHKNIILGAGLLFSSVALMAQADTEKADTLTRKVNVAFRTVDRSELMGGVSSVDVEELTNKSYSSYSLDNMQSFVGGFNGQLWNMGDALVLVDGVPRETNNIRPSEITQITFLKAAQAVVLYGSRGAKGVILITTKRGGNEDLKVSVRANSGINVPKSYPKYLASAEYMTLYNEALGNDGLAPAFSDELIYNYASGANPYRYPNINFFSDDYIRKTSQDYNGVAEFSGGGRYANFYTNIGYESSNDLLNFGESKNNRNTRLNIRGNVDLRMNDWISGWVNANAIFYDARGDKADYWNNSATLRPTAPGSAPLVPFIPIEFIDENDAASWTLVNNSNYLIDGKYLLGGTQLNMTNPFAAMYASGYRKATSRRFQFDAGINLDLERVLKGLSFRTQFSVDYGTSYITSIDDDYAVYEAAWNNAFGADRITSLTKYNMDKHTGTQNVNESTEYQTIFFSAQFGYQNTFADDHHVSGLLLAQGYQRTNSGEYHRISNANLGLQANYNYAGKYYADFSMAAVHSAKLPEGNRLGLSPSLTLGWRLTEESFMEDADWLDNLKLTAGYSVLNQDLDIREYYMYATRFTQTGTWWGWSETHNAMQTSDYLRGGNPNLGYIKRKEFTAGLDASLWKGFVKLNANFFLTNTEGLLAQPVTYPSYFQTYYPVSDMRPYINANNQRRTGVDWAVNIGKKQGDFEWNVGLTGMYYTSKNTKWDEMAEFSWLENQEQPIDALRGYQCLGFFKDEADVENSAKVNSNTKPGDLKYVDQNKDGIIDNKDQVVLGKWSAPLLMGLNLTAKYKGFTLFVAGAGSFGGKGLKDNRYMHVYGDRKYSEVVRGRWTPETAATATYPRLTTQGGDLNFVPSDFWLYSTSRFDLNRVQLTYDFPAAMLKSKIVKGLQIYANGTSLLTLAKEREYMEMNVGTAPQLRSYSLGVKVDF
ncbi:SusC/RagA family TonB-linked outer membrane protein [Bacteroides sp. UBA939]|uniref:SusC/RagA family TonB-linked outer membrane protein n=1 Tax=Bacteroides sp. UBA939 TaxID=1946092 RepID=UPI0025C1AFD1|nr:SusC/RagA family TonB-linked outer membrane protein [Bacteroides sp. UBA939]